MRGPRLSHKWKRISNYSLIRRKNSFLFHHHQDNIPTSPHIPPKCMLTYLLHTKMLIPAYTISFNFWMAATYCISGKKNSLFYTSKRAWWTALLDGYLLGFLISIGSMDRVRLLYGQCFSGWMCGSGAGGSRSRRNLWIISKLVKVITAAGVVRNRFVAHPR